VKEIIKLADIKIEVVPITAAAMKRIAKVSDNESAANWRMSQLGFDSMPNWRASLAKYISGMTNTTADRLEGLIRAETAGAKNFARR
jgi:hypothetical protein